MKNKFRESIDIYKVTKPFSDDNINTLRRCYELYEFTERTEFKKQDYNIRNAWKQHAPTSDSVYMNMLSILNEHTGAVCDKHYFLNYVEGSWTKMHSDDDAVSFTGVTIIEQSEDLLGGDTLVLEDRESGRFHKINVDIGETVWYDHDILHAVTNVERGNRKVLVTWMKAQNDS